MADFLFTYAGMYLAQSLCHSAVAAAVADSSLLAWRIMDPRVKQRFRLIVIVAPVVSFPLYQLINPGRGSIFFRLNALFDVNRWFFLEVFGFFTIWTATLVISSIIPVERKILGLPPVEEKSISSSSSSM